jgi:hypothetical protein
MRAATGPEWGAVRPVIGGQQVAAGRQLALYHTLALLRDRQGYVLAEERKVSTELDGMKKNCIEQGYNSS